MGGQRSLGHGTELAIPPAQLLWGSIEEAAFKCCFGTNGRQKNQLRVFFFFFLPKLWLSSITGVKVGCVCLHWENWAWYSPSTAHCLLVKLAPPAHFFRTFPPFSVHTASLSHRPLWEMCPANCSENVHHICCGRQNTPNTLDSTTELLKYLMAGCLNTSLAYLLIQHMLTDRMCIELLQPLIGPTCIPGLLCRTGLSLLTTLLKHYYT